MSFPLHDAIATADKIVVLLKPHCNRIHVAGSIRRFRPEVKDIEIVCEPMKQKEVTDLFGGGTEITVPGFADALATITDQVIKGSVAGRHMQIITNSQRCPGIKLDLFMPQPDDYWRQYAIRTGSWEYVQRFIAGGWSKKGWCGTDDGLRRKQECKHKDIGGGKFKWVCVTENPTLPPVFNSEGEFFTWLGLNYIDPEFREFNNPVNVAQ